jgi:Holin of 3TMs, for gene-transfer release
VSLPDLKENAVLPLLALAQLVPTVAGLFTHKHRGSKVARAAVEIAQAVTGAPTPDAAVEALKANPGALAEYQSKMEALALEEYKAESDRLTTINETMRVEATSSDPYVRRMRPTFGYAVLLQITGLVGVIGYLLVTNPLQAVSAIGAVTPFATSIFTVELSVLGVYVYQRSQEKRGAPTGGIIGAVKSLLPGGR